MDERIIELETRIAYQDRRIADLDDVVLAFTARVERLERLLAELDARLAEASEQLGPADEKPPHY